MKSQELEVVASPVKRAEDQSANLLQVIERAAGNSAIDVEKMERLLAMQEKILAKQSEAVFNVALTDCQKEMPPVLRDAKNPATNSRYTKLETLLEVVTPIYTKNGFALSFGTDTAVIENTYRITCDVSHAGGHTRKYHIDIPADLLGAKGNPTKSATHAFGSTMSYGRRYLTLLIFNIALTDDDGNQGKQQEQRGPMRATDQTRNRMIEVLKEAGLESKAMEYAIFKDWIQPGDTLHGWPLDNVPVNKAEMETLRQAIANFKPE